MIADTDDWYRRGTNIHRTPDMILKRQSLYLACLTAFLTAGCDAARDAVYQAKQAPDEFAVYTRAPLSLPPEYSLRPPTPGAAPRNTLDPKGKAVEAVFGSAAQRGNQTATEAPAGSSTGVVSILERTGALNADPAIRDQVERETSVLLQEDDRLTDQIMFWKNKQPFGTVVDPAKEQARVQENQALGKDINEGDTAIIERRKSNTIEKTIDTLNPF